MTISPLSVIVIGAGHTGLNVAVGLKEAGVDDIVVLGADQPEPGSWRAETIELFGLADQVSFGHRITRAASNGPESSTSPLWTVETESGRQFTARALVLAEDPRGSRAQTPEIPGIGDYRGRVLHANEIDDTVDLAGLSVAVIGNAAAAAPVLPVMVRKAARVKLFQTSPDWVLRTGDAHAGALRGRFLRYDARQAWFAGRHKRVLGVLENTARRNLRQSVENSWTQRQLMPYRVTDCPNVVVSDEFYQALQAPNCKLITWPIAKFSPEGIRSVEGVEHQCDAIVFAANPDMNARAAGFSVLGADGSALGSAPDSFGADIVVASFPNLFLAYSQAWEPSRDAVRKAQRRVNAVIGGVVKELRPDGAARAPGSTLRPSLRTRAVVALIRFGLRPLIVRSPLHRMGKLGVFLARQFVASAMSVFGWTPPGSEYSVVDPEETGVKGEWVRAGMAWGANPLGKVILYVHGSGYVVCSAKTHRKMVSRLSAATGLPAFSVDYRLAPDHVFPAAADDVRAAYEYLLRRGHAPEDIVLSGDSAGGHLIVDLLAENARNGVAQPAAVALFSPLIDLTFALAAERELSRKDPIISAGSARGFLVDQYTRLEPEDSPRLQLALSAGAPLPPLLVQVGSTEMLAADAEHLALMYERAGGECELQIWPGQIHVFQALPRIFPEAEPALRAAARFLTGALAPRPERAHTGGRRARAAGPRAARPTALTK